MKTLSVFLTIAVLAGSASAYAQSNADTAKPSKMDRTFVMKASKAGMDEVNAGQLAVQKSNNQEVKTFAQKMIDDHGKAGAELQKIAAAEDVQAPPMSDTSDNKAMAKLQGEGGTMFDRDYIADQRKAHKEAVELFTKESKSGRDEALRNFATQTLPTLREHYKMITAMAEGKKMSSAQ